MEDGVGRAVEGLGGALDEFGAGLAKHLNRHVVRHHAAIDDLADEIEIRLRRRRKTCFDFHETHLKQQFVETQLFVDVHRIDEGLIAVAQVNAAPAWRRRQGFAGPLAVRQINGREGLVFGEGHSALATAGNGSNLLLVHHETPCILQGPFDSRF